MFGIKSPSLLIRISHLILIQIVFIFTALALVFIYPENDLPPARQYSSLTDEITAASHYIHKLIEPVTDYTNLPHNTSMEIQKFVDENDFITNIDLVFPETQTGVNRLVQLAYSEDRDYYAFYSGAPAKIDGSVFSFLNSRKEPILSSITNDGEYINYFIRSEKGDGEMALIFRTPNSITVSSRNSQAYLLLLLFLISALISLLIINLISDGIKKPLAQLIEGFEKTAAGQEFFVEEKGDKQIKVLARAFNSMSRTLTEKQNELADANYELIKTNQNLIESESILTKLVDYSPDAIIVTDLDDHILIYNQAAAREFGSEKSNMTGKRMTSFVSVSNETEKLNDLGKEFSETICRRLDGSRFPALLVHTPLGMENGKPMAMLYFIKNISESENYKGMILKLDRIATRGKMARDIAHEINNYLAVLQGNLELIPMILAKNDTDKVVQKVDIMKETVGKITNFTSGLTRFSDENSEFEAEDLNQLIENLVAFLKPQNKFDDITITTNLAENIPLVEIDSSQIQHLLVNLINNAAEAVSQMGMGGDKWIVISTLYNENSREVSIKISDGGLGIKDEYITKLFINRFSTKREGTGLGLITCKNIVDNHQGEISYHSSDESKSVFTVKFRVVRQITESDDTIKVSASKIITS